MTSVFITFKKIFRNEWLLLSFLFLLSLGPLSLSVSISESLGDAMTKMAILLGGRASSPSGEIIIVDSSQLNIAKRGPIPLAESIKKSGAKLIVLDSHSADIFGIYDGIKQLGEPIATVVGFNFIPTLAEAGGRPETSTLKNYETLEKLAFPSTPREDSSLKGMMGIENTQIISAPLGYIKQGFENTFPDDRGVVTMIPLAVRFTGRSFPSLALSTFSTWKGFTPIISEDTTGQPSGIKVGKTFIKTLSDTSVRINFRRAEGTFPSISIADILDQKIPQNLTRDRILVFSGSNSTIKTAAGEMTDASLQASIIENLIHDEFLRSFRKWQVTIPAMIFSGILFMLTLSKLNGMRKIVIAAISSLVILFLSIAAMPIFNLMLPGPEIAIFIILAAIASTLWKLIFIDSAQKKLSQEFGWRLSREAIDRLSKKPELISTSTRLREGSALVLDIKAFGKISELKAEDDFRNFLIDYRTIATGIITSRGGFIENWNADECVAVFGAPVPLKNDALQAVLSAVEIKKSTASHLETWRHKFGIEKVRLGIGISRGNLISSDFGLGFGFAGSAIEGAKQLNRLNRLYKTWALVSGLVVAETEKELEYRALDPVKIWGVQNPSVIFEIVGESGTLLPSIRGYEEAREAYLQGNFTRAAELFSRILEFHPNDGPSKLFCRRSIAMASNPPESWGGVWKQ